MTIAFPNLPPWPAAGWVTRMFCELAATHAEELPHVGPEIQDCLDSGIYHVDLRDADAETLAEARRLVERVLADAEASGGRGFQDPAAYPVFLERLRDLRDLAARAAGDASVSNRRIAGHRTVGGGRVIVTEILERDGVSDGVFRGHLVDAPHETRLITLGRELTRPRDELRRELALPVPGVAALEYLGPIDEPDGLAWVGDCIVEIEPRGLRAIDCSSIGESAAIAVALGALDVVERAHAMHLVLRGIRPESLYVTAALVYSGLAPRADPFLDSTAAPSSGMRAMAAPYRAVEDFLLRKPVPASDVFSLCATLFRLVAGRHPFGAELPEQLARMRAGAIEPWPGSPALGQVLAAAMAPDPARRPTVAALRAALAAA